MVEWVWTSSQSEEEKRCKTEELPQIPSSCNAHRTGSRTVQTEGDGRELFFYHCLKKEKLMLDKKYKLPGD